MEFVINSTFPIEPLPKRDPQSFWDVHLLFSFKFFSEVEMNQMNELFRRRASYICNAVCVLCWPVVGQHGWPITSSAHSSDPLQYNGHPPFICACFAHITFSCSVRPAIGPFSQPTQNEYALKTRSSNKWSTRRYVVHRLEFEHA